MINHITRATILLAIAGLDIAAAICNNKKQNRLRRLYYSKGHEVADMQTKCDQVSREFPSNA